MSAVSALRLIRSGTKDEHGIVRLPIETVTELANYFSHIDPFPDLTFMRRDISLHNCIKIGGTWIGPTVN